MQAGQKQSTISRLQKLWQVLSPWPGGRWLFSRILGRVAPYTGSIGAVIQELRPGYVRVVLRERKKLRNHLNSVHAIALANLGEVASGLAMLGLLSGNTRGIITCLSIEYFKKARGVLTAECRCSLPEVTEDTNFTVHAEIRDQQGDVVARLTAQWRLGLVE